MNALEMIAEELAAEISSAVRETVCRELGAAIKREFTPCYSEKEAAALLKISEVKLAELRKAGEINHSYSIPPTAFKPDGSPLNGRAVYMPDDILNYLLRLKKKNIEGEITFDDVFGYLASPENSKVIKFKKKAA